jgi:hypothetical protein
MNRNFHSDRTGCTDIESNRAFSKINDACKNVIARLKPATPGGGHKESSLGLIAALTSVTVAMAFCAQ